MPNVAYPYWIGEVMPRDESEQSERTSVPRYFVAPGFWENAKVWEIFERAGTTAYTPGEPQAVTSARDALRYWAVTIEALDRAGIPAMLPAHVANALRRARWWK